MDVDLTWSDAARQAAIAARRAKAQAGPQPKKKQKPQGTAIVPAGQKLPMLNRRQREGIDYRDRKNNGQVTNKRAGTAIAAFQKSHGLPVTGTLDPATRKRAAQVAKKSRQAGDGKHLLAKAVQQIGRSHGKRAANLLVKHDKRVMKRQKMKADLSNDGKFRPDIDLGKGGSKWKHGYVPENAAAVALKAHKSPGGSSKKVSIGVPRKGTFEHGPSSASSSNGPGPSNADKIKNAEKMFGTNSPQHLAAKKRFGAKKGSFYHGPKSANSSN